MPYSEECCGFGGTFATKFPMISSAMGDTKAANAESTSAEYITSTDPSCLMHIDGILRRRNSRVRTIHLASILAQTAASAEPPARSVAVHGDLDEHGRPGISPQRRRKVRRPCSSPHHPHAESTTMKPPSSASGPRFLELGSRAAALLRN